MGLPEPDRASPIFVWARSAWKIEPYHDLNCPDDLKPAARSGSGRARSGPWAAHPGRGHSDSHQSKKIRISHQAATRTPNTEITL